MRINRELAHRALHYNEALAPLVNRSVGRSTVIALRVIADSIDQPGTPLRVHDHWPTQMASAELFGMVKGIVDKLGLTGFTFNVRDLTITNNFSEKLA